LGERRSVNWYGTSRWAKHSAQQLRDHPLCVMCLQQGEVVPAKVADHVIPHRGNEKAFWFGTLQSLCGSHHSGTKQMIEKRGYHTTIGFDGWPTDPHHPVNKIEKNFTNKIKQGHSPSK